MQYDDPGLRLGRNNDALGYGVSGTATTGYGVYGFASSTGGVGVYGFYDGSGSGGQGVYGDGYINGVGTQGNSTNSYGVRGESTYSDGVAGQSGGSGNSGTSGWNTSSGNGVWGGSSTGTGVYGSGGSGSNGVYGTAGGGGNGVYGYATGTDAYGVFANGNGSFAYGLYATCSGSSCAAIYANGNINYTGSLTHVSDQRLKRDIEPLKDSLDKLTQLRPVSFYWQDPSKHGDSKGVQRGFIAQDYEKVFPEWVTANPDGFKMIQTDGLHALEVESIQQLKTENDDLRKRIELLEAGRRPIVSSNAAWGWMAGMALACAAVVASRRKSKADE